MPRGNEEQIDAAGHFSRTSLTALKHYATALLTISSLLLTPIAQAQNTIRVYDSGVGHLGEGGGLLVFNGTLISGAQDSKIKVWDLETGQHLRTVTGHTDWVHCFAIVGGSLFSAGRDTTVRQWALGTFAVQRTINIGDWILAMTSYSNTHIIVGDFGGTIYMISAATGEVTRTFTQNGHTGVIRGLVVNGDTLYSGAEDNTVRMWNILTNTPATLFSPSGLWVNSMVIANNRLYVSGHDDGGKVREWQLDGTFVRTMSYSTDHSLGGVSVSGNQMLTAAYDGLRLWNLETGTIVRVLLNLYTYNLGATATDFYTFTSDGCSIRRWNATNFEIKWQTPPNYGWNSPVSNGVSLWAGRGNGEIHQFDVRTGARIRVMASHTAGFSQMILSGNSLFSANHDRTVKQWNTASGTLIRTFAGHTGPVTGIAIKGNTLITASWDSTVNIWNINNGMVLRTIVTPDGQLPHMAAAGDFIFTGSADHVSMWSYTNGSHIYTFTDHTVTTFQLIARESPSGSDLDGNGIELFVADWNNVKRYDVGTRTVIRTFGSDNLCHMGLSENMLFGGTCYYSTPAVHQWDIDTQNQIRSFTPSGPMHIFGTSLFLADTDGVLKELSVPELWRAPVTPSVPVVEAQTTADSAATTTPEVDGSNNSERSNGRANANASSILSNNNVIIPVAASGIFIGAVLAFVAIRSRHTELTKQYTATMTTMAGMTTVSSIETTSITAQLPTITALAGGAAAEMTYAAGTTINQTAVTQTYEVSIPAFLEMRWGLDFRQEDFLTKGGGGSIYRATCLELDLAERSNNQPLVLKHVAEGLETMDEKNRTAFFQEISLMWRFRGHPNFIAMYAYSTHPVTMVMKFYKFGDLAHLVSGRGRAVKAGVVYSKFAMVSLLRQLHTAISYMHQNGIVHNDVKPANVLLDQDAEGNLISVLTDFGISRIVNKEAMKVQSFATADLRGASLAYASPEAITRFRKRLVETDPQVWMAADAFALAITALQMMIRTTPWRK